MQEKVFGKTERLTGVQLSLDPLSTSEASRVPFPVALRIRLKVLRLTVGATVSSTVTRAVQEAVLPEGSAPVKITGMVSPTSAQVKLILSGINETEQLSDEPLLMADAFRVAVPKGPIYKMIFLQETTGLSLSSTVTLNLHESILTAPLSK
jgi:hypothetical protein